MSGAPSSPAAAKAEPSLRWRSALLVACAAALVVVGALFLRAAREPRPIVIAFANSLSGPIAPFGREALVATRIYLDEINKAGGIDGRRVQLALFDDQGSPDVARRAVPRILASPALAVLGHSVSATSAAAGPLYRDGHIAAITGNASSDEITRDNPYYFCALSPNSAQAEFLAEYVRVVFLTHDPTFMRTPDVDLLSSDDTYGRDFREGYTRGNGGVMPKTFTVRTGEALAASAAAAADRLAGEPEPRIIVLGTAPDVTTAALKAIRRRGIRSLLILSSSSAADSFAEQFTAEPEEKDEPGFFLDNVYAIAPIILDSTGELGQAFATAYRKSTGERAGWIGAAAEDSARVLVEALRRAHIGGTAGTRAEDREKVRQALASIDDPASAPLGINGPLYFDANREMPRPIRYGFFRKDSFISAPLQLVPVENPDLIDVVHEMDAGHIVQIGDLLYWLQRVVYTGIDITELNRVDTRRHVQRGVLPLDALRRHG
jgi:branched-chain amino acid transport system substrate-binding protein